MRLPLGKVCFLIKPIVQEKGELPYLEVKYLRKQITPKLISKGLFINKNSHIILVDGENSGEVFDVKENGYMGSTFMQLVIPSCINADYIKYFIQQHKELLKNNKKGSAIPHLNKELFKNLQLLLPNNKNQNIVVNKLNNCFNNIQTLKAELN